MTSTEKYDLLDDERKIFRICRVLKGIPLSMEEEAKMIRQVWRYYSKPIGEYGLTNSWMLN
jgi:hypothetical protein